MKKLIQVSISDFKLVFRNPSLRVFLVIPLAAVLIVNVLLPYLAGKYEGVIEYIPYVLMAAALQTSTMFGFIYCMVFIEEKETQVAKVYGVVPVSKPGFALFRLIIPFFLSTMVTWLILSVQPFYSYSPVSSLIISFLA